MFHVKPRSCACPICRPPPLPLPRGIVRGERAAAEPVDRTYELARDRPPQSTALLRAVRQGCGHRRPDGQVDLSAALTRSPFARATRSIPHSCGVTVAPPRWRFAHAAVHRARRQRGAHRPALRPFAIGSVARSLMGAPSTAPSPGRPTRWARSLARSADTVPSRGRPPGCAGTQLRRAGPRPPDIAGGSASAAVRSRAQLSSVPPICSRHQ